MKRLKNRIQEAVWLQTEATLQGKNISNELLSHYAKNQAEQDELSDWFWLVDQLKQLLVPYRMSDGEKSAVHTTLLQGEREIGRFAWLKRSLLLPITLISTAISVLGIGIMLLQRRRARRLAIS